MRWGLVPHWNKGPGRERYATINARAETVASKPSYRTPFRRQRCLVPADGFFELRKDAGRRVPYFIHLKREPVIALAGLYDTWEDERGVPHRTFTVITTEANDLVRPIHDRMPVILPREAEAAWLDPDLRDPEALAPLLVPYPAAEMEAYPVSPRVNDPRVKDPALLRRAA
jgi:putative SOS response-associated peptidase YedK